MNPHNERLFIELFDRVKSRVFAESDHAGPDAVHTHLHNIFNGEQQTALDQVEKEYFFFVLIFLEIKKCFF